MLHVLPVWLCITSGAMMINRSLTEEYRGKEPTASSCIGRCSCVEVQAFGTCSSRHEGGVSFVARNVCSSKCSMVRATRCRGFVSKREKGEWVQLHARTRPTGAHRARNQAMGILVYLCKFRGLHQNTLRRRKPPEAAGLTKPAVCSGSSLVVKDLGTWARAAVSMECDVAGHEPRPQQGSHVSLVR